MRACGRALRVEACEQTAFFFCAGVDYVRAALVGVIAVSGVLLLIWRDPERRRRIRAGVYS